jgi:hypothetical protein
MPSLTPKVINGRTYYYVRECRRVDGRPKIVRTIYLGSLENILAAVEKAKQPPAHQSVDVAAFGDVVALYDLAEQIGLVSLIDEHVPKRRRQGLTPGQYLLLAAINRAAHPTSKVKLAEWYRQTALPRLIPATARQLSSQAFWNPMDFFEEHHIEAVERALCQRLVEQFGLSLRTLTYDGTNFFSYINTNNNSATLPQRGHNKQKRNDLRQVSLGMLVSTDFHVPLFHKVYEGNVHDATVFKSVSEELRQRYVELAHGCEHITLVFDKGNNSQEAFETVDASPFHFVGSLVPTQHRDLLEVPLRKFQKLPGERLRDCRAYRTQRTVFGPTRTVVVIRVRQPCGRRRPSVRRRTALLFPGALGWLSALIGLARFGSMICHAGFDGLDADAMSSLLDDAAQRQAAYLAETAPDYRKRKGQVFTPPELARFMAGLFTRVPRQFRLLDPGAGAGLLSVAVCARVLPQRSRHRLFIHTFEPERALAEILRSNLEECKQALADAGHTLTFTVEQEDFIAVASPHLDEQPPLFRPSIADDFDAVIPDIVLYDAERNWLFLIEAVTSHGPVSPKRHAEIEALLSDCPAERIYITAFLDRGDFRTYAADIAWEREVWIAENPGHMVHFNGPRFLGPYKPREL